MRIAITPPTLFRRYGLGDLQPANDVGLPNEPVTLSLPEDPEQRRLALHRAVLASAERRLAECTDPASRRALASLAAVARRQLPRFNLRLIQSGEIA